MCSTAYHRSKVLAIVNLMAVIAICMPTSKKPSPSLFYHAYE